MPLLSSLQCLGFFHTHPRAPVTAAHPPTEHLSQHVEKKVIKNAMENKVRYHIKHYGGRVYSQKTALSEMYRKTFVYIVYI